MCFAYLFFGHTNHIREAFKKNVLNLGHLPNRGGGLTG